MRLRDLEKWRLRYLGLKCVNKAKAHQAGVGFICLFTHSNTHQTLSCYSHKLLSYSVFSHYLAPVQLYCVGHSSGHSLSYTHYTLYNTGWLVQLFRTHFRSLFIIYTLHIIQCRLLSKDVQDTLQAALYSTQYTLYNKVVQAIPPVILYPTHSIRYTKHGGSILVQGMLQVTLYPKFFIQYKGVSIIVQGMGWLRDIQGIFYQKIELNSNLFPCIFLALPPTGTFMVSVQI